MTGHSIEHFAEELLFWIDDSISQDLIASIVFDLLLNVLRRNSRKLLREDKKSQHSQDFTCLWHTTL
ncbi:hypothetical protein A7Q09_09925 [Methylacidiphilum sp. Yel]|jgi:hypothetical protein|nr:hypothetical protein A7Q09_09925 [Methylacidiphilum sp. Yel]